MISIWLIFIFSLNGVLISTSANALTQKKQNIGTPKQEENIKRVIISDSELPTEHSGQIDPNQALIIGRWRGYQETPEFTIYYGYEFRPNGVYAARHRVYQQEKTILDQYWQGKWNFDGQVLSLEGTITNSSPTRFNYSFILDNNNFLSYQNGNLPEPYLPAKMGKIGEIK